MNKIIVVIPTYNERQNIAVLIPQLFTLPVALSVVVVDDNSPDKTAQEVEALRVIYKDLSLIMRDRKKGLGSAYKEGFKYAIDNGYDIIVQMDADLSHGPQYIPLMLSSLDKYDMVIGSRYVVGGVIQRWQLFRRFLSRFANYFAVRMIGIPVKDVTSGFAALRCSSLTCIDFHNIVAQGYSFQIELKYRMKQNQFKLHEIPIVFQGRKKEHSKMSWGIIFEAFWKVFLLSRT